jgi:hypothetical protein
MEEKKELQLGTLVFLEAMLFLIGLAILPVSAAACLITLISGNVIMAFLAAFTDCFGE